MNAYRKGIVPKVVAAFLVTTFAISPLTVAAQELVDTVAIEAAATDSQSTEALSTQEQITPFEALIEEVVSETKIEALQSDAPSESAVVEESVDAQASEELAPPEEMSLLSGDDELPIPLSQSAFSYQNLAAKVDQNSGALTQRIQLDIPPGRNGMQPDLALEYNSQRTEDSIVGYGWTISIPYIERINKTGSQNLYSPVTYFTSSLHGELATTSTATTSPTSYKARVDSGHSTAYSYDRGNDTWTVYDKDGTRYRYGASSQSRQSATSTYKWMLEEIRDTNNNFVRYVYAKDENQLYPYQILYTGYDSTDGIMTVSFATSTRPDTHVSYKPGFKVTTNHRISQITASVEGAWVRKYTLSYSAGNNGVRSLLSGVQLTGRDASSNEISLPPIAFSYISTTTAFVKPSASTMYVNGASHVVADVNGNALNDITVSYFNGVSLATTTNWFVDQTTSASPPVLPDYWARDNDNKPYDERGVRFVDIDADGKADVVSNPQNAIFRNTYSSGTYGWSLFATSSAHIPDFYTDYGDQNYPSGLFGDFNGDGLPDYATRVNAGSSYAHLGNGFGWDSATSTIFVSPYEMSSPFDNDGYNSHLVDINGDGFDDWIYSEGGNTYVRLNTGLGWEASPDSRWTFGTSTTYSSSGQYFDRGIRFLDINGDGLPDLVRAYKGTPQSTPSRQVENADIKYVYLNTGSGWATSTAYTLPQYIMSAISGEPVTFNEYANWTGNGQQPQDVLSTIAYPKGGNTAVEYTKSAMMGTNSDLPVSILTVTKLTTNDNNGTDQVTQYSYTGGKMYTALGVRERRFAGFSKITETRNDGVTDTYFNQGDDVNTSLGEQADGYELIGKPFRVDVLSQSAATLKRTYNKWDISTTSASSTYVHLVRTMTMDFDSVGAHKDKAEEYEYATSTGDLLRKTEYGEVTGSGNGAFTDVQEDIRTTIITYAASSSINLSVPTRKETTSIASSTPAATSTNASVLVVGGGGGGGGTNPVAGYKRGGGGGGAGGVKSQSLQITPGTYAVTVGSGGSGGSQVGNSGDSGWNSSIASSVIATGGGGGGGSGHDGGNSDNGQSGGSGGGGSAGPNEPKLGGSGTSGQGNDGGDGNSGSSSCAGGGGGGGSGAVGSDAPGCNAGGSGGSGTASSITGTSVTYGGGGGGGGADSVAGSGGSGGGGSGGTGETNVTPTAGAANTGGGGGGAGSAAAGSRAGASGGSGIVIIKYPTGEIDATGGTITQSGGYTIHTFATSSSFVVSTSTTSSDYATSTEEKYYYDGLSYGSVGNGNNTRTERWITGSQYASTTKTYNAYGLIATSTDERGKTTSYSYDTANMYPASVTNALSQVTQYTYNYANGKVEQETNPNARKLKTTYDAVGRVKELGQSDLVTPSTLVTQSAFTYSDSTSTPPSILRTDYLNAASTTYAYQYLDGLGRVIQERRSTENAATSSARDILYSSAGLVASSSLPYFSTGTSYTSATSETSLYSGRTYDGLQRPTKITTSVGSTTNMYAQWTTTTVDPNGNTKKYYKDAFGNLVQVDEINDESTYVTEYDYDDRNNLTQITDALDNVRSFTYDGLGRRTSAEDLHAAADGTYGMWAYTYDDAGNLTSYVDPKNQTINRTYDDVGRPLTEDFTGGSGTEIMYTYDSCTNGIGFVCTASSTGAYIASTYDVLGRVTGATTTIDGTAYGTHSSYDRQGNPVTITAPDGTVSRYIYGNDGRVSRMFVGVSGNEEVLISNTNYEATGAPTRRQFANSAVTTFTYDPAKQYRLLRILTNATSTTEGSEQFSMSMMGEEMNRFAFESAVMVDDVMHADGSSTSGRGLATSTASSSASNRASDGDNVRSYAAEKGKLIARIGSIPKTTIGEYEIEVVSMRPISGGVELYARAWDKGGQIGFGADGSVDIERFRIFNPPILVDDVKGDIVREWIEIHPTTKKSTLERRTLREDPKMAVLQVVAHNISVMRNVHDSENIISGKRGKTVSTFFPDAHPETSSVDGYIQNDGGGTNWSTDYVNKTTGTANDSSATTYHQAHKYVSSGEYTLSRAFLTFDTSALGDSDVIGGATISLHGSSVIEGQTAADYGIFSGTTASSTSLTSTDYDDIGSTLLSSTKNISSISTSAYNDWSLNSSGTSTISKTGTTTFVMRSSHDYNNSAPSVGSDGGSIWASRSADYSGTSADPKLVIEHSSPYSAPTAPTDLQTEDATNPTNVADHTPEFSAVFTDTNSADLAYLARIQVATSTNWTAPLWDSGTTTIATTTQGYRSPNISYRGPALEVDTTYYWRIKFWDDTGLEGAWSSSTSTFALASTYAHVAQDLQYEYDAYGNIVLVTDDSYPTGSTRLEYSYDDLNRLTSMSASSTYVQTPFYQTYEYDELGNMLLMSDDDDLSSPAVGASYAYSGSGYTNPHAPTSIGDGTATTTYAYDNNGNLTTAGNWSYTWDYLNRLTQTATGTATTTFGYDYSGQRVISQTASSTTVFPNKYFSITSQTIASTTYATSTSYIFANDQLVAYVEQDLIDGAATGTPRTFYVHPDHLGSTNVITGENGEIISSKDYLPFGSVRIDSGDSSLRRGYIGEFEEGNNLSYLNARYYQSDRGQFLSQDPTFLAIGNPSQLQQLTKQDQQRFLTDPQQLNSYSYARGNPIVNKDPQGNFAFAIPIYFAAVTAPEWAPAVGYGILAGATYIAGDILLRQSGGREFGRSDGIRLPYVGGAPLDPLDPWEGGNWKPGDSKDWKTWVSAGIQTIGVATGIYEAAKNLPSRPGLPSGNWTPPPTVTQGNTTYYRNSSGLLSSTPQQTNQSGGSGSGSGWSNGQTPTGKDSKGAPTYCLGFCGK